MKYVCWSWPLWVNIRLLPAKVAKCEENIFWYFIFSISQLYFSVFVFFHNLKSHRSLNFYVYCINFSSVAREKISVNSLKIRADP